MPEQDLNAHLNTDVGGAWIGDSVGTDGGDFVGRDQVNFYLIQSAVRAAFPDGDQRPEEVDRLLEKFHQYHQELQEWKNLHNYLDRLKTAYYQFFLQVERFNQSKSASDQLSLIPLWSSVKKEVGSLTIFAEDIEVIGRPFEVQENGDLAGEDWSVQIYSSSVKISKALDSTSKNNVNTFRFRLEWTMSRVVENSRSMHWNYLYNISNEFQSNIDSHMTRTDMKLLKTATELYHLSRSFFQK